MDKKDTPHDVDCEVVKRSLKGVVKWFNDSKGFGFIALDGDDEEIFVHYSSIDIEGFKTLKEGQAVVFDVVCDLKGHRAQHVRNQ